MTIRNLTCSVCGAAAGRWAQHWNRDTGYGVCARCVAEEAGRETPAELEKLYGKPGVNYEQPTIIHYGRFFHVMAAFPNTEKGKAQANGYMLRTPEAALLCVEDRIYLASIHDMGEQPSPTAALDELGGTLPAALARLRKAGAV